MDTNNSIWISFGSTLLVGSLLAALVNDASAQVGWGDNSYATTYANPSESWEGNNWIGTSRVNNGWTFGVNGENTNAGVLVRQVMPNSAAARSNIVPGDVIVCVSGDQVGRVGNQIFDLGEELNHHADSTGSVPILVYWRRGGQYRLQPMNVQLQDRQAGISGSIAVNRGRLPANSVVTVRLENVSRPWYTVRGGEYSFRLDGFGVGDVPFTLNYDPRYINNTDTYRLRAFVTAGGQVIYDTFRPPMVLTQGNPSSVRLVLQPSSFNPGLGTGQVVNVGYTPINAYQQEIAEAYQRYLGRTPTSIEVAAWYHTNGVNDRVKRIGIELMATQEYFNRFGGNNAMWIQRVFTEVIGHQPTTVEVNLWMQRFAELRYSRTELLNQLYMQASR